MNQFLQLFFGDGDLNELGLFAVGAIVLIAIILELAKV